MTRKNTLILPLIGHMSLDFKLVDILVTEKKLLGELYIYGCYNGFSVEVTKATNQLYGTQF